jgi:hypothetical protein
MIENNRRNRMGTASYDGKFDGMRKAQDFIVYPFHAGNQTTAAKVQSDTRIGYVHLTTGAVLMSKSHASGAYGVHLVEAAHVGTLTGEELMLFKSQIASTAHGMAGTNGIVYTDNSGAMEVFGQVQA